MHPSNQRELDALRGRYYFSILEGQFNQYRREFGLPGVADHLTEIMKSARHSMEKLIAQRKVDGEIENIDQARKSLAGNIFQNLVFLTLVEMQAAGLVPARVLFALKPKRHPIIQKFAVVRVGDETLKPDLDLMAYAEGNNRVAIYSLKTSLRERAGQTQRWKLLMEIAAASDAESIRSKYNLRFDGGKEFKMNLITTNFYNEITKPQQRGLLKFFDRAYLTKPEQFDPPVLNFSRIAEDLTDLYGN